MEIQDWQAFYDSLAIVQTYGEPVPKPTVAQLDQFEAEVGFRLPQSYRSYITVFGPGELLGQRWKIAAPGYQAIAEWWDLARFHQVYNPSIWLPNHFPVSRHDCIRRCFYFGFQEQDAFGWDLGEVTDAATSEYAVYHMTADMEVLRVADSFRRFVEWTVERMGDDPDEEWDEEEYGPQMSFRPAPLG
jgi:hypothetical protein